MYSSVYLPYDRGVQLYLDTLIVSRNDEQPPPSRAAVITMPDSSAGPQVHALGTDV